MKTLVILMPFFCLQQIPVSEMTIYNNSRSSSAAIATNCRRYLMTEDGLDDLFMTLIAALEELELSYRMPSPKISLKVEFSSLTDRCYRFAEALKVDRTFLNNTC
jgi:hypothetical protein